MPTRGWDLLETALDLTLDPVARTVAGTATHTLRPLGPPDATVTFHAVGLTIDAVAVDGQAVPRWTTGTATLTIPVPVDAADHVVAIRYHATPTAGLYFRGGPDTADAIPEIWSQGEGEENRYWYPGWDSPNDRFTLRQAYTVPEGYTAIGNGAAVGQSAATPGWTRWEYALDASIVNYLVMAAVGPYAAHRSAGPVPLETWTRPGISEEAIARTTGKTSEMLTYFGSLLDEPYPYPVYRQTFVQRFLYGGMENASSTIIADSHLLVDPDRSARVTEKVVAHEAAHQWFGDLITCYGWRELWLNEGFAEYYQHRWHEHDAGEAAAAFEVDRWFESGLDDPAPMAARSWTQVDGRDNAQVYARGAAVLRMLEVLLGRDLFDAGVRRYVDANAGRLAESEAFRRAMEDVSGQHLGWLFDRWVYGAEMPALTSTWSWADGVLELRVTHTAGPLPGGPVAIEIGTDTGPRTHRLWLDATTAHLQLPLDAAPRYVAVDPARGVLARWTHTQPVAAWRAQLDESPQILARREALRRLAAGPADADAVRSVAEVLSDPGEATATRALAAHTLGAWGGADGLRALDAVRKATDPDLRAAVVEALAQVDRAPEVTGWLAAAVDDPSPEIARTALRALGDHDPRVGLPAARRALRGRSSDGSLHDAAAGVLGAHGEASDLPRLIALTAATEARDARHAAARAATALWTRSRPAHQPASVPLARALESWLDDPDRHTAALAIALLAQVGDDTSAAALRRYAATHPLTEPPLAARAHDAIAAIGSRGAPEPETPEGRAALERLRADLAALTERLDKLETLR